jgi:hypothetical protein
MKNMKSTKKSRMQKMPEVVVWRGLGILSPQGVILDGYAADGARVLKKLESYPPGSRLVHVLARLERVTRRQVAETRGEDLGIVSPETSKIAVPRASVPRIDHTAYKVFEITPEGEELDLIMTLEATDDSLISDLKKWDLLDRGLPLSCILVDFDKGTYTVSTKVSPRKTSKFIPCLRLVGPWRELGD